MPTRCTRSGCRAAVSLVDSNGVTDPTKDRVETYQCANDHTMTITLEGR